MSQFWKTIDKCYFSKPKPNLKEEENLIGIRNKSLNRREMELRSKKTRDEFFMELLGEKRSASVKKTEIIRHRFKDNELTITQQVSNNPKSILNETDPRMSFHKSEISKQHSKENLKNLKCFEMNKRTNSESVNGNGFTLQHAKVELKSPASIFEPKINLNQPDIVFFDNKIASIIGTLFRHNAFGNEKDEIERKQQLKEFMLVGSIILQSYGQLMSSVDSGVFPCDFCIQRVIIVCENRFKINTTSLQSMLLMMHSKSSIQNSNEFFNFCYRCHSKAHAQAISNSKFDSKTNNDNPLKLRTQNTQRIQQILELSEARKIGKISLMSNIDVFNQLQVQKAYLVKSLLFLEKKILSDTIFKIHYAKNNNMIELLMTKPNFKFSLSLRDLQEIDKFRENSLFKIAKSSFKCYNSFFSYNVSSSEIRRRIAQKTTEFD